MTEERQTKNPNIPTPEFIRNEPVLKEHLVFYLIAYFDLSTTRQSGMGLAPISYFSIRDYAIDFEMGADEYEDLEYFIRKMEEIEFKIENRKNK